MSHAALQWVWSIEEGISKSAKYVLLALANRVNQERGDNLVWPSCERICKDTLMDRKAVYRALAELCDAGLIVATGIKHGRSASTPEYEVKVGMTIELGAPEKGSASQKKVARFAIGGDPKRGELGTPEKGSQNLEDITRKKNQEGAHPGASEAEHLPEPTTWQADTGPTDQPQEAVIVTLPVNHNPDTREQPQSLDQPSKPKARSRGMVALRTYLRDCADAGIPSIPKTDAVFTWAQDVGLPPEFLALCWQEFRSRHIESDKKYRDWRQAFRNCARGNWYRLWWVEGDGSYTLTTVGHMVKRRVEAEQARQQGMV